MANFFSKFPTVPYDIAGKRYTNYQTVTNIFVRFRIIKEVLGNISAYYEYIIKDGDTPEILADKIYGDPEAHWIILMANEMVDAHYDWPLNNRDFRKYIIGKYGSVETAKTTIHHYEKVIVREQQATGSISETRFIVNQEKLTDNDLDVPYDYYEGDGSLAETAAISTYNLSDGMTVIETISRDDITCYDYEHELNENKRAIKIIKPEYYLQLISELDDLLNSQPTYIRRLV